MLAETLPDVHTLDRMAARFAPVELRVDTSKLTPGDRAALTKLVEAARVIDSVFQEQLWSGSHALHARLLKDRTPLGQARLRYFEINQSPWSDLDGHSAFVDGAPPQKLPGANFYPENMTREEFETWAKTLDKAEREQAESFFTVIRRDAHGKLQAIPFSAAYRADLQRAARLLDQAAALTGNASLKRFLTLRAKAFLTNDYYESDLAWMDLDASIDPTIGPYESYNDELFGYKAGFEAYITVRDDAETNKLASFAVHLQDVENNLPMDARYRNPKLGGQAPIRVVNVVISAGDGNHGVQTAAYNLPNDERVITEKGSKRVMLKNIQEAKFEKTLAPIARRVLSNEARAHLGFEPFFTHMLAHELSHGIGPHRIVVDGRPTTLRQELKELYSAIEEAKADITGLFMLQYFYDHELLPGGAEAERQLYTTFLASSFRTLRFGVKEAHGQGMAVQFNYLLDKGGFVEAADGTFGVDYSLIKDAVRQLTHDILTIEATGDYAAAKRMLDTLGVIRPDLERALGRLSDIPIDIRPIYVTAAESR